MSQRITSMLSPSSDHPPSFSDAVPSYNDHTLDERFEPSSSHPVHQATSETPRPRPLSSNNPYRQLLEHSPPLEAAPGISLSTPPQPETQVSHQTPPASPTHPSERQQSSLPRQQTPAELDALQATAEAAQRAPEFLSLDRDLIFPPPPSQALYSLAFALSPNGRSNTVRRSVPAVTRADGSQRSEVTDKDIYTIRRDSFFNSRFIIEGKRRSTFPGTLNLRTDLGREPDGVCLGRKKRKEMEKEHEKRTQGENVAWKPPVLELVGEGRKAGGDDSSEDAKARIRDLLVTCWVAKCWDAERVAAMPEQIAADGSRWKRRSEVPRGTGMFF
ncbi:hypothetical protein VE04_02259 [Pseudogymnoascus sp. 24MN13]|nr:hypothetical protein VE04_02259 [Pseudogymnoascus sp. 24MN13]